MKIKRAKHSGFCFGVQNAIDKTEEAIRNNDRRTIYTCGQLIHNKGVTDSLHERGVDIIDDISQAKNDDIVIVRSHGEPKEFYDKAKKLGVRLIDATCVFVSKIHDIVYAAYKSNRTIVIVGSKEHQEVKATNGWCNYSAHIIESISDANNLIKNIEFKDGDIPLIVCQTTIRRELLDEILNIFKKNEIEFEVKNTICNATRFRQESCKNLAEQVDAMIVIGDPNSSNSRKLFEIAEKNCKNAYFVQCISDLALQDFENYNNIGIAAGASTPEVTIKEVISRMNEEINKIEEQEEEMSMADFMEEIDKSLRLPRTGDIITGTIHEVRDDVIIVNMGVKKDGILPKSEVALEEGQELKDLFHEGDEIEAKVMKSDDGDGGILLSKKKLEMNENWKELNEALENKTNINVKLVRAVNRGVIAEYKEVSGFIPMSLLSDRYVEKADEFIGKNVDVKVIKIDNRRNRAVFSRKQVLLDEKRKQVAEIWENLNIGDVVEGKVMRFTDYGAFVDIGGVDGLLHISEISWGKLKHPQEVLSLGDIINVKILDLNEQKGKISLGLKQTTPEPWSLVGTKYNVGDIVEGKVVQIKEYGAFVELEAGLDGLVHISEIANKRVENVADEMTIGKVIKAKIMDIDSERKRISLSMKALLGEEDEESADEDKPEIQQPESEVAEASEAKEVEEPKANEEPQAEEVAEEPKEAEKTEE